MPEVREPCSSLVHGVSTPASRIILVGARPATFHFLTEPADRVAYMRNARDAVRPGGHLVVGTFAVDGPEVDAEAHARRLVTDGVDPRCGLGPRVGIADVTDHEARLGPGPLGPLPLVRHQRVEDDDVRALVQQCVDHMGAHEPAPSGDEDPHQSAVAASTMARAHVVARVINPRLLVRRHPSGLAHRASTGMELRNRLAPGPPVSEPTW